MSIQEFERAHDVHKERLNLAEKMHQVSKVKAQKPKPPTFLKAFLMPLNLKLIN